MVTTIKIDSYADFADTFALRVNEERAEVDAGLLAKLLGTTGEPSEFVGKTYSIIESGPEFSVSELSMSPAHEFSCMVDVKGWGSFSPVFDYDFMMTLADCPGLLVWLLQNAEKIMGQVDLDSDSEQPVTV